MKCALKENANVPYGKKGGVTHSCTAAREVEESVGSVSLCHLSEN